MLCGMKLESQTQFFMDDMCFYADPIHKLLNKADWQII